MKKKLTISVFFKKYVNLFNFKISNKLKIVSFLFVTLTIVLLLTRYIYTSKFETEDSTVLILDLFIFYIFSMTILNLLKNTIVSARRRVKKLSVHTKDNVIAGIHSLYIILGFFVILFGTLHFLDVELEKFFTSFALISVAFSWIFKEYISNIIDGIRITFSDNLKVGDYITSGDFKGIILDIDIMSTKISTDEGDIVFIPNTLLLSKEIINYSKIKFKRIIYDFEIDKSLYTKLRKLEKKIVKNLDSEFSDFFEKEKFFLKVVRVSGEVAHLSAEMPVTSYNFKLEERMEKNVSLTVMEFIDDEED